MNKISDEYGIYYKDHYFYKVHLNNCKDNHTLEWAMPVKASMFRADNSFNISLGGFIRKAVFDFGSMSPLVTESCSTCYMVITWIDNNILNIVPSTLSLDSKQYNIYTSAANSQKKYNWYEAES